MAKVFVEKNTMTNIGNAIRSATRKTDLIFPKDMPNEIKSIKIGDFLKVTNSIIDGTVTNIHIDTPVENSAFYYCKYIKPTFGDNCTAIGANAFYNCESIAEINTNKVTIIESSSFYGAKNLTKVDLPNVIRIGSYAFYGTNLQTMIIRSNSICILSDTGAFNNSPIAKGEGYIYVPKDLLEQYKESTNWVKFAEQFRAIEDYPEIARGVSLISNVSVDNILIDENIMTNISNAIKSKTGKKDLILPKDMPSEINSISAGKDFQISNGIINRSIKDICIDAPVRSYAFRGCKYIKPTFGDNCTSINRDAFQGCESITEINTNKITFLGYESFSGAKNLTKADLPNVTRTDGDVFEYNYKLETLILRANKVCPLYSNRVLYETLIEKDKGYIYVPKDLLEQYKESRSWSKYVNQFRAIEDYPEITGGA